MPKRDGLRADMRDKLKLEESVPGWQERALERERQGASKDPKQASKKKHGNYLYLHAGMKLKSLLNAAAKQRGVSRSTYARRAMAAYIAHDLGLEPEDVLEGGPRSCEWGKTGADVTKPPGDDLSGYGAWRLDGLHE